MATGVSRVVAEGGMIEVACVLKYSRTTDGPARYTRLVAAPTLFDVELRWEAEEPPEDAREQVTNALAEAGSMGGSVRGRVGVSSSDRGVTIQFDDVAVPGDTESPAHLQDVLPVVQALINAIAEQVAANEPTNPRLVIEVRPAEPHQQHELRHS
jgi:hypothetical protein